MKKRNSREACRWLLGVRAIRLHGAQIKMVILDSSLSGMCARGTPPRCSNHHLRNATTVSRWKVCGNRSTSAIL
jgi:hypothetical protein